jgi:uncharacterized membrane protein YbhN (UPF0104 family)
VKRPLANVIRVLVSVAALALLLYAVGLFIRAYRWWSLIRALDPAVSYLRLVGLYFVGQFFSIFLPSAIGGDAVRALELTQDTDSSAAVGTVLLDRMTGLLALFAMGLAALPFYAAQLGAVLTAVMAAVMVGGLAVGVLVLEARFLRRVTQRLPQALSLAGEGQVARVYAAVTGCGWPAVGRALGVSFVYNVVNVFIFWLCGRSLGAGLGLGYLFAAAPLVGVAGLVPSLGGWGVREIVSTAVLSPAGTGANVAAAMGMAVGLVSLGVGLVGGVLYLFGAVGGLVRDRDDR